MRLTLSHTLTVILSCQCVKLCVLRDCGICLPASLINDKSPHILSAICNCLLTPDGTSEYILLEFLCPVFCRVRDSNSIFFYSFLRLTSIKKLFAQQLQSLKYVDLIRSCSVFLICIFSAALKRKLERKKC